MDKSKLISEFVEMTKADKRLLNKKRKAEALLTLLNDKQKSGKKLKTEQAETCENTSKTAPGKLGNVHDEDGSLDDGGSWTRIEKKKQKKQRLKEVKLQIKKIQKQEHQERPAFYLKLKELASQRYTIQNEVIPENEELPPLYMLDLQHLLVLGLLPNYYINYPRWCKLARPGKVSSVVVIVLDQLTVSDLEQHQECFPFMKKTFNQFAEIISPYQYDSSVIRDVFSVPFSTRALKKQSWYDKPKPDQEVDIKPALKAESEAPSSEIVERHCPADRQELMLSPLQLMHEGYPMPVSTLHGHYKDFQFSFDSYRPITKNSPLFAIDCEMCMTTSHQSELTRISVVNEDLQTIYDTLVKPRNKITNYLTRYSGITAQMLEPVTTRLEDVQKRLRHLLPSNSIWVGQSLNNDLIALKLFHPYVIDTSVIFNLSGFKWKKTGLRALAAMFLKKEIQCGSEGHDSVEDAKATMELVLLKLRKGMTFGDATFGPIIESDDEGSEVKGHVKTGERREREEKGENQISNDSEKRKLFFTQREKKHHSFFSLAKKGEKTAVVIDRQTEISGIDLDKDEAVKCMVESSDRARTQAAMTAVQTDDFVWIQLHGLGHNPPESQEQDGLDCDVAKNTSDSEKQLDNNCDRTNSGIAETLPDRGEEDTAQKKKCLRRLDKRVKKIVERARGKSLVCVVMSGQTRPHKVLNGGVFIKIT